MIDEKKIEETAHEYSWFNSDDEEGQLSVKRAFQERHQLVLRQPLA